MPWIDNAGNCCHRLVPADWMQDSLQKNALRVETISVSHCAERCTLQPPEHWTQAAKDRSALWCFSGGSPLVFGECKQGTCPRKTEFDGWEKKEITA